MRRGYWLLLVALILLVAGYNLRSPATASLPINGGTLDIGDWDFERRGALSLAGDWLFFPRQLHTPASLVAAVATAPAAGAAAPLAMPVPATWNQALPQRHSPLAQGRGYGTYALKITGGGQASLSLLQQQACTSSRSFFFPASQPAAATTSELGRVGLSLAQTVPHQKAVLSALPMQAGEAHYLLLQVANFDHRLGGLCGALYLGTQQQLFDLQLQQLAGRGLTIAIIFSMALYAFAIYFYTPRNRSSLWLGLWALTMALYLWTHGNFWEQVIGLDGRFGFELHYALEYGTILLLGPLILLFHHHAYRIHYLPSTPLAINIAVALLLCLIVFITPARWFTQYYSVLMYFTCLQLLATVYILLRALYDRQNHAVRLLIGMLPLCFTIPADFVAGSNGAPAATLTEYAMVFFIFIQCLVQGRRMGLVISRSQHLSNSLAEEVKQQTASLEAKNYELLIARTALEEVNRDLKALSITDGLTGAYNRLYFDRQFLIEWQRSRREQTPLSLVLVDIDHFKALNDRHGHLAGDQGLKDIVRHMQAVFQRASDVVCRYGGEEFVVLLPNTPPEQATAAAEKLRQLVEATPMRYNGADIRYTVSIGIGGLVPAVAHQPLDLLSATDQALYQVKRRGRNGICVADTIHANIRA